MAIPQDTQHLFPVGGKNGPDVVLSVPKRERLPRVSQHLIVTVVAVEKHASGVAGHLGDACDGDAVELLQFPVFLPQPLRFFLQRLLQKHRLRNIEADADDGRSAVLADDPLASVQDPDPAFVFFEHPVAHFILVASVQGLRDHGIDVGSVVRVDAVVHEPFDIPDEFRVALVSEKRQQLPVHKIERKSLLHIAADHASGDAVVQKVESPFPELVLQPVQGLFSEADRIEFLLFLNAGGNGDVHRGDPARPARKRDMRGLTHVHGHDVAVLQFFAHRQTRKEVAAVGATFLAHVIKRERERRRISGDFRPQQRFKLRFAGGCLKNSRSYTVNIVSDERQAFFNVPLYKIGMHKRIQHVSRHGRCYVHSKNPR